MPYFNNGDKSIHIIILKPVFAYI